MDAKKIGCGEMNLASPRILPPKKMACLSNALRFLDLTGVNGFIGEPRTYCMRMVSPCGYIIPHKAQPSFIFRNETTPKPFFSLVFEENSGVMPPQRSERQMQ
jgi:hypothetical protein